METISNDKLDKFQRLGMALLINFDEREVDAVTDMDGETQVQYHYTTAKVSRLSTREERIEAIIRTKYHSYGAELAAMHKGGNDADDYMSFRDAAKVLATDSLQQ